MSSATSIEESFRLEPEAPKADARNKTGPNDGGRANGTSATDGFRPWHFFVLASLAASTAAVILSRQSAPEHLILISLTIGAAGAAAAAFYRTIAPLAVRDESVLAPRASERARATLEREKALVLRSIKELEFDRAMGKVSARDFDEMAGRLRSRAMALMKQLDAGGSAYREIIERELRTRLKSQQATPVRSAEPTSRACASCRTVNDPDAAFCKRCGTALRAEA